MGMGTYGAMDHGVSVRIPPWGYWGMHGTSSFVGGRTGREILAEDCVDIGAVWKGSEQFRLHLHKTL